MVDDISDAEHAGHVRGGPAAAEQLTDGKLPLTLVVLDEMQQYINDDNKIAEQVQYHR